MPLTREKHRCCKDMTWQTRPGKEELWDSFVDSLAALAVESAWKLFACRGPCHKASFSECRLEKLEGICFC